ncbi:MAG: TetR/AcrR family transcriptional regulator [Actinomycetota bacterium]
MAKRLTRNDWISVALDALADAGLPGVAVEPLAADLGVTKGSFYSHFADRPALISAAIDEWRAAQLARLETAETSVELLDVWFDDARLGRVFGSLCAAVDDVAVRPAMFEVSAARLGRLTQLLEQQGLSAAEAGRRARVVDAAYVGFWRLVGAGSLTIDDRKDFAADLVELCVGGVVEPT